MKPAQSQKLIVRPATAFDDTVCGLIAGEALSAGMLAEKLPHARSVFRDQSPLGASGGTRLMADYKGYAVAFIDFTATHINYLFVDPNFQRQGLGSILLSTMNSSGKTMSVNVLEANEHALFFYQSHGFEVQAQTREENWHGGPVVWLHLVRKCAAHKQTRK